MWPSRAGTGANDDRDEKRGPCGDSGRGAASTPARPPFMRTTSASDVESDVEDAAAPLLPRYHSRTPSSSSSSRSSYPSFARPSSSGYSSTLRKSRVSRRLAALGYNFTVIVFAATCLFAASAVTWALHVFYQRHNAFAYAVFSAPLIPEPKPVEGLVAPFSSRWTAIDPAAASSSLSPGGVDAVLDELDARFDSLALPLSTELSCAVVEEHPSLLSRYSPLRGLGPASSHARSRPTLFALNLYNSEAVIPSLSRTLLSLATFLGPETIHVSIFENGSRDNTTVALAHLAASLTAANVPHTITSDPRRTDWSKVERITQLAVYRNVAFEPLWSSNTTEPFEDVIAHNDVFSCPKDLLELLFQRKAQNADAACAMDWRGNGGLAKQWNHDVKFYDNWVSRSITGRLLRSRLDVFGEWSDGIKELWKPKEEEYSRERFRRGLPVPVYSCWNGVVALNAAPFTTSSVAPRYSSPAEGERNWKRPAPLAISNEPTKFRAGVRNHGECGASECKTLARDFWTRGFDRWLIVPTVRVTYDLPTFSHPKLLHLSSLNPASRSSLSLTPSSLSSLRASAGPLTELIDWPSLTPPMKVRCFDWVRGWSIDLEWWRSTLEPAFGTARYYGQVVKRALTLRR